ncbi:MAG TPA: hypothetical protein VEP67_04670, partial [Thiobacillaceae bacterium]|nr:hypothetical protein [Thiobacillaceae bacterium]
MKTLRILLSTLILTLLAACGGGGGGGGGGTATQGSVSGTATKGAMSNATVTAFAISNGLKGTQIRTTTTDGNGNFSMNTGSYGGPMMLQVSGTAASWTDEAGRGTMTMPSGDVMTAVIPEFTAGTTMSGIQVTPITAMAQAMAQHISGGMTAANIAA